MSKPQDHKTPKPSVAQVDGGRSVTLRGVTVTVPDDALNDFEFLDDLRALDVDGNASRLPSILRRLVGDDYRQVMDALRGENGRVTIESGADFIKELLEAISPES